MKVCPKCNNRKIIDIGNYAPEYIECTCDEAKEVPDQHAEIDPDVQKIADVSYEAGQLFANGDYKGSDRLSDVYNQLAQAITRRLRVDREPQDVTDRAREVIAEWLEDNGVSGFGEGLEYANSVLAALDRAGIGLVQKGDR